MINKKEFEILYREQLKPQLIELEKMRREIAYFKLPVTIIVALIVAACLEIESLEELSLSVLFKLIASQIIDILSLDEDLLLIFFFIAAFVFMPIFLIYREKFKKEFVQLLIHFINPNLKYFPKKTIDYQEFQESKLFSRQADEWKGEDYVEGALSDQINLKFSQITTARYTIKEGKETEHFRLFQGVLSIANLHQNFQGFIHILPALSPQQKGQDQNLSKSEWSKKVHELWKEPRPGQAVTLDAPFFTRYFEVYSDVPESVPDILSPALMKELVAFRTEFNQEIYVAFIHSKIYVVLPNRSIFEPPLYRSLLDLKTTYRYLGEIQLLLGILEEFGLYHPILKKSKENDAVIDDQIKQEMQSERKPPSKLLLFGSIILLYITIATLSPQAVLALSIIFIFSLCIGLIAFQLIMVVQFDYAVHLATFFVFMTTIYVLYRRNWLIKFFFSEDFEDVFQGFMEIWTTLNSYNKFVKFLFLTPIVVTLLIILLIAVVVFAIFMKMFISIN